MRSHRGAQCGAHTDALLVRIDQLHDALAEGGGARVEVARKQLVAQLVEVRRRTTHHQLGEARHQFRIRFDRVRGTLHHELAQGEELLDSEARAQAELDALEPACHCHAHTKQAAMQLARLKVLYGCVLTWERIVDRLEQLLQQGEQPLPPFTAIGPGEHSTHCPPGQVEGDTLLVGMQ